MGIQTIKYLTECLESFQDIKTDGKITFTVSTSVYFFMYLVPDPPRIYVSKVRVKGTLVRCNKRTV